MYRICNQIITGIVHNYEPVINGVIAITGDFKKSFLQFFADDTSPSLKIDFDTAYDFVLAENKILFTNKVSTRSYFFDLNSKKINLLPYVLHIKGLRCGNDYLCYSEEDDQECWLTISLESLQIIDKYASPLGFGSVDVFLGDSFLSCKKRQGIIARFDLPSNECSWQTDIKNALMLQPNHKIEIDQVVIVGSQVIAIANCMLLAFDLSNGRLIWKRELSFRPIALSIRNTKGYIVTGNHFSVIDLDSGKVLLDKKLEDGSVMWIENVNTPHSIHPPKFHDDRMYILDTGGTLHIYEKMKQS